MASLLEQNCLFSNIAQRLCHYTQQTAVREASSQSSQNRYALVPTQRWQRQIPYAQRHYEALRAVTVYPSVPGQAYVPVQATTRGRPYNTSVNPAILSRKALQIRLPWHMLGSRDVVLIFEPGVKGRRQGRY